MSDLGELRERVETAQRQLKCLEDQRRQQSERLVALIDGIETQVAERQAALERQDAEIQTLKQDNAELRELLDLLLRSAEETSRDALGDVVDQLGAAMAGGTVGALAEPAPETDDSLAEDIAVEDTAAADATIADLTFEDEEPAEDEEPVPADPDMAETAAESDAADPAAPTNGASDLAAPDLDDDTLDMVIEDAVGDGPAAAGADAPSAETPAAEAGDNGADDNAADDNAADDNGADDNGAGLPDVAPATGAEPDPHEIATAEDLPMGPEASAEAADAAAPEPAADEPPADEIPEPAVEEPESPVEPEIPDTDELVIADDTASDMVPDLTDDTVSDVVADMTDDMASDTAADIADGDLALDEGPMGDPAAVRRIIERVSQIAEEMSEGVGAADTAEPAEPTAAADETDATDGPEASADGDDLAATA